MHRQSFTITHEYAVHFTSALFSEENSTLVDLLKHDSDHKPVGVAFVVDQGVLDHHPKLIIQLKAYCERFGLKLMGHPLILPGGEQVKNDFSLVTSALEYLDQAKIDRHSYLVAIGGGALLDMVGFVAAIGHRGIRHIRIPTTVLSQNDSGVGVKNGINFLGKKNFIGTFAPPVGVICDRQFLTTLSDRDWRSGIPEAIKVALLKDPSFYYWIEEHVELLKNRDLDTMMELVERCAKMHMDHISTHGDPFEKGSSRPLDFGHWAAHKLEQLTGFSLRHGEAVAIGLAIDNVYASKMGWLDQKSCSRILGCLKALGFELFHPGLTSENGRRINPALILGLEEFREHLGGELTIMLLNGIGKPFEVHEMDHNRIESAILELKENTKPVHASNI